MKISLPLAGFALLVAGCAGTSPEPLSAADPDRVEMECRMSAGRLTDCRVLDEAPSGRGLNEAALRAARRARLNPDGVGQGTLVRFTVRRPPEGTATDVPAETPNP